MGFLHSFQDIFPLTPGDLLGPWIKRLVTLRWIQVSAFLTRRKSPPFFVSHLLISEVEPTIPMCPGPEE